MSLSTLFKAAIINRFQACKKMGDDTFKQLNDQDYFYTPGPQSNSIAIIIQHMYGNAMSRFTDFLTTDGEKEWRNRDAEFKSMECTAQDLLSFWEAGWKQLFSALQAVSEDDLQATIYIRGEPLLAFDAFLRQLAHYACHVGQIVYIAKALKHDAWKSLTIPRGQSAAYNQQMKTN